ncbi:MAG: DUF1559 domain-containing protein [Pirellulaceae bacterium]
MLILLFLCVAYSLLLSDAPRPVMPHSLRAQCANNLKQIAIALHTYPMASIGTLPPAYTVDANGRRMHSWRVLLLPALGRMVIAVGIISTLSRGTVRTTDSFIRNRRTMPLSGNSTERGGSHPYQLCGGDRPGTVWPGAESIAFRDIADGTAAYTMMIVESDSEHIHWMEPRDLDVEQAVRVCWVRPNGMTPSMFEKIYGTAKSSAGT